MVKKTTLSNYEIKVVGGAMQVEYRIPAEELEQFNQNVVGKIEVIAEFKD